MTISEPGSARKPLHSRQLNNVLNLLLSGISLVLSLYTIPWRIAVAVSPRFIKQYVVQAGLIFWALIVAPIVQVVTGALYATFDVIDSLLYRGVQAAVETHRGNMEHFKVAVEAYLRLMQQRAELVERHGLRGIPMALGARAA